MMTKERFRLQKVIDDINEEKTMYLKNLSKDLIQINQEWQDTFQSQMPLIPGSAGHNFIEAIKVCLKQFNSLNLAYHAEIAQVEFQIYHWKSMIQEKKWLNREETYQFQYKDLSQAVDLMNQQLYHHY